MGLLIFICACLTRYDTIKMDLQDVLWGGMDWIYVARDKKWRSVVNVIMNLRIKCG
jgi:hypothetical protein